MLYINQGDLVDFGHYGNLYVCDPEYSMDYFWVTDDEYERFNKYAPGWSILKELANSVIESPNDDEDLDECVHEEDGCCKNCYRLSYKLNDLFYALIVEAPDEETAKSLLLMRNDAIEYIVGIDIATEEDKIKGIPILTESTPIDEAEEYLVSYRIEPLSFTLTNRIKAEGERDAKKRFSYLKPDAKIADVRKVNNKEAKLYPIVS